MRERGNKPFSRKPRYPHQPAGQGPGVASRHAGAAEACSMVEASVLISASYVSWGVIHHGAHKDICWSIILEYVAVSVLGLIMVLTLIFRA